MNPDPILSVKGVWFAYANGHHVLQDVSFEVSPGTVNAVLGPNGAGKSTLLFLILGLYAPQRGEIILDGRPIRSYPRQSLSRRISLVPQREHIPFNYTVLDYVLLGRTPHLGFLQMPRPEDIRASWTALERLGIASMAHRPVANLSGGEHQMVLIARAIAQETPILLLDEPTAHLDLGNQRRILTLLRDLADQGMTVLFTTHDPDAALAIADRFILLVGGRLLHQGPVAEITAEKLSRAYSTPLQMFSVDGRKVVLIQMANGE